MGNIDEVVSKQYVVFRLLNEEYGIDIQKVTTIEKVMPIARIPKTPLFVKGVINLRGEIVPVIDLRIKFGFLATEYTEESRIIVIKTEEISAGVIVDEVDEVVEFDETSVENVTNFNNDLSLDYIYGVGKVDGRIVTLLNHEKIIKISDN